MSVAFVPPQKGRPAPSPAQIQKMLDENSQLIQGIVDYQNKGKAAECLQYQQILHRNLVYLASIADAVPSLLPPPPSQSAGNNSQPAPATEPSQTTSPLTNQGGVIQQTHSTVQVNSQSVSRGSVAPVASSTGIVQGSGGPPHTSYNATTQSTQPQQAASHAQTASTQPQQPLPQSSQSSTHSNPNIIGSYNRSITPQQYGSMQTSGQQYGSSYSSSQNQSSHQYGNTVPPQNSFSPQNAASNFSNEGSSNYQAPVSQQGFGSNTASAPQQQQQQPVTSQQQQQQHQHAAQDYPNNTLAQATTYNTTAATTSQTHTTQSSQTFVTQTQSYVPGPSSSAASQWYQASNSQPCSASASQANYPSAAAAAATVAQAYTGSISHSMSSFQSQSAASSNYDSPPAAATSQGGFSHHSPSSTPQESTPPPAPVPQNRFSSNFSGYVHYRPSSQATPHSVMGSPMGPPSNSTHRPPVSGGPAQNQSYNYEQPQGYQSYQSQ